MRDGRPLTEMNLDMTQQLLIGKALDFKKGTDIEKLLREYYVI